MKFTKWETERILEALNILIEEQESQGGSTKSFQRLRAKFLSYGELTGKSRVQS